MGNIFSGVGLVSGLNITDIVDRLVSIEARPRDLIAQRMRNIDAQRTAYMEVSARLSAILARIEPLTRPGTFRAAVAASSRPEVLTASAGDGAVPGTHTFRVRALAATHQVVSRGFASRNSPIGPGSVTIESAHARVDRPTRLDELNGFSGVQRGQFVISDRSGREATIDITDALTLREVVDRINAADLGVEAAIREDHLELRDTSEGTGTLRIRDVEGGSTAADLGFAGAAGADGDADGRLAGGDLMRLSSATPLSALNDGLGVRRGRAGADFTLRTSDGREIQVKLSDVLEPETRLERLNHGRGVGLGTVRITSRDGHTAEVDLRSAVTVGDVQQRLSAAFGDNRISVVMNGNRLIVSDGVTADPPREMRIEDVSGSAARDLGIAGVAPDQRISGTPILFAETLGDVLAAINYAAGNGDDASDPPTRPLIEASIAADGRRLQLRDVRGGDIELIAANSSTTRALADLGLPDSESDPRSGAVVGRRIVSATDSVLLNTLRGGAGVAGGRVQLRVGDQTVDADLRGAETLSEALERLRSAADSADIDLDIGIDRAGTRLRIADSQGRSVSLADASGQFAASLGLDHASGGELRSDNVQRRYLSENTLLSDVNNGRGAAAGRIRLTNSRGATATLDLREEQNLTLGGVIERINALNVGVRAEINANGDGLVLRDTAGGTARLRVEDDGGTMAHDLNLLGDSQNGVLDGSFEQHFTLGPSESLDALVARINTSSTLATAGVFNDGTGVAPYRLRVASAAGGAAGELIVEGEGTGLDFSTLTRGQDARVLLSGDGAGGILITGTSNTLTNVVDGVTLNLVSADDQPVNVSITRNIDSLVETLSGLVSDFNGAADRIRSAGRFDSETGVSGPLQGESALSTIETRLFRIFTRTTRRGGGAGDITRLSQLGVRLGQDSRLTLDEDALRAAYDANPRAVEQFFSATPDGAARTFRTELQALTQSDGLIDRRADALQAHRELLDRRVTQLNGLLENKRARLLRQYQAMEQALSQLQSQQSALAGFPQAPSS